MVVVLHLLLPFLVSLSFYSSSAWGKGQILLNSCKYNRHIVGEWIVDPFAKKSFVCCSVQEDDYLWSPKCSNTSEFDAWFDFKSVMVGKNDRVITAKQNSCYYDKAHGRTSVNQVQKYKWVPSFCDLRSWDASLFCEKLGDRKIMFEGDSTVAQSAITLMSMIQHQKGGCADKVVIAIKDYMMVWPFRSYEAIRPDIIVFAAGAHYHELSDYRELMKNFTAEIKLFRSKYRNNKVTLLFKTQNPGHIDCGSYTAPLTVFRHNTTLDKFSHRMHPVFDSIAKDTMLALGIPVLDVSPLYLRPDAHANPPGDCLHYALPGALDLIPQLLLNMLLSGEIPPAVADE